MTQQPTTDAGDTARTPLRAYVKATDRDAFVDECSATAETLVDGHIGGVVGVPPEVRWAAVLEVGADLWNRRSARAGVIAIGAEDQAQAVRINRDPLASARPILRPYLGPGIA